MYNKYSTPVRRRVKSEGTYSGRGGQHLSDAIRGPIFITRRLIFLLLNPRATPATPRARDYALFLNIAYLFLWIARLAVERPPHDRRGVFGR
jgi:hypothetical protein